MEFEKDKQTGLNIYSNLSLFSNDPYLVFLYRKCQSLVAALYLITDFFPDQEPLKWNIRDCSNSLLRVSLSFSPGDKNERMTKSQNILSTSIEILSLCQISSLTNLISKMNFDILKKEFEALLEVAEKEKEPFQLGINFSMDQSVFKRQEPTTSWLRDKKEIDKGHSTNKTPKGLLKDNKSDRRAQILNLLKEKNDQSIKELSDRITECSEKTIQRELIKLVEEGALIKKGERRWSRYSLSQ